MPPDQISPATVDELLAVADVSHPLPEAWGQAMNPEDWQTFIAVAGKQRVLGVAACRLNQHILDTAPDEARKALQRARHGQRLRAMNMFREVDHIVRTFAAEDMPCIPFKGADLARRVYADPAMRPFEDLDLLVRADDLPQARQVMEELGYAVPSSLLPAALVRRFHFHLPMVHPRTRTFVELHWRLADRRSFDRPHEDLLERARVQTGSPHRVLPADVYAVYVCAHLGKHGYLNRSIARHDRWKELVLHPWSELRLIWFIDLYLLMQRHGLTPEAVLALAKTCGCEAAAVDALALCSALFANVQTLAPERQPLDSEGPVKRYVKKGMITRMCRDGGRIEGLDARLPWLLRTNKLMHVRPVRLLDIW